MGTGGGGAGAAAAAAFGPVVGWGVCGVGLTGDPGGSFWLGENSPSRMVVVVVCLLFPADATEVTTVGCTVAVGGAAAAAATVPPGEADRISGPAG